MLMEMLSMRSEHLLTSPMCIEDDPIINEITNLQSLQTCSLYFVLFQELFQ